MKILYCVVGIMSSVFAWLWFTLALVGNRLSAFEAIIFFTAWVFISLYALSVSKRLEEL